MMVWKDIPTKANTAAREAKMVAQNHVHRASEATSQPAVAAKIRNEAIIGLAVFAAIVIGTIVFLLVIT